MHFKPRQGIGRSLRKSVPSWKHTGDSFPSFEAVDFDGCGEPRCSRRRKVPHPTVGTSFLGPQSCGPAFASPQLCFGSFRSYEAIAAILVAGRVLEEGDTGHSIALTYATDLLAAGGRGATKNGGGNQADEVS